MEKKILENHLLNFMSNSFRNIILLTGIGISSLILSNSRKNLIFGEVITIVITIASMYINYQVYIYYKNYIKKYNLKNIDEFHNFWKSAPFIILIHIIIIVYALYNIFNKINKKYVLLI